MDDMKKILDEYKLSAKEVLMMMAKKLGYDSLAIRIYYHDAMQSEKVYSLYFAKGEKNSKRTSMVWSKDKTKKNFVISTSEKIFGTQSFCKKMLYDKFLEMMFDGTKNGCSIYAFPVDEYVKYSIVLHPYDTLELFLMNIALEDVN